jgi:hypothetical protein
VSLCTSAYSLKCLCICATCPKFCICSPFTVVIILKSFGVSHNLCEFSERPLELLYLFQSEHKNAHFDSSNHISMDF